LENTTTEFSSMIFWAFSLAETMAAGDVFGGEVKKVRARLRKGEKIADAIVAVVGCVVGWFGRRCGRKGEVRALICI
jgi:hypothetical protein